MATDLKRKDYVKAGRLKEVYEHVTRYYNVTTETEFAEKIQKTRAVVCAALNGTAAYLTQKFFANVYQKYPGAFNLEYLMRGEGELLTKAEKERVRRIESAKLGVLDHVDIIAQINMTQEQLRAYFLKVVDSEIAYHHGRIAELMRIKAEIGQ